MNVFHSTEIDVFEIHYLLLQTANEEQEATNESLPDENLVVIACSSNCFFESQEQSEFLPDLNSDR
jgi:hypothetical protein